MLQLYRHQKIALANLRLNNGFALFMEQGTGKTIPTLVRLLELAKNKQVENILIVAPKSATGAWSRDLELFEAADRRILEGMITIVTYDKIWRGNEKSPYNRTWDCIVLDEAHYIKNRTSKRAKFILKLATRSKWRYVLTGTPHGNGRLEDYYSLFAFLYPKVVHGRVQSELFGSYYDFCDRYCILNQYHQPSQYINVSELQGIINEYSYRVKKSDCLDLPDKLPDEVVEVEIGEKSIYKRMMKESALIEYEMIADNPLVRRLKMRQICAGFIQNENETIELKSEKISILDELIDGYPDEEKLVIFAHFKYSIRQICTLLKKKKIKFVVLDGDQKNKTIWRDFQTDKSIQIIVCQYQTANAGIDLYAASTMIFYEPTDRSVILEQARDRIHRNGQTQKCSYIHLLTKGTVEVAIYRALAQFKDFDDRLFTEYMNEYRRSWV